MVNRILPFYPLNNGQFNSFIKSNQFNNAVMLARHYYDIDKLNKMTFNMFEYRDKSYVSEIEPDNFLLDLYNCHDIFADYHLSDEKFTKNLGNKNFSCFFTNINSLPKHHLELQHLLNNELRFKFNVISLCESKLAKEIENLYELNGYTMFSNSNLSHCRGLVTYIDETLNSN